MKEIILAIIPGFFSLAGIWYQNYLSRRSNAKTQGGTPSLPITKESFGTQQNKRSTLRIFFTILVATLPWIIWKFVIFSIHSEVYKHMDTYAKIMVIYFLVWLIATMFATLSGWNLKSFFEKLILILSSAFLIYWIIWMIVHHHLLN